MTASKRTSNGQALLFLQAQIVLCTVVLDLLHSCIEMQPPGSVQQMVNYCSKNVSSVGAFRRMTCRATNKNTPLRIGSFA